MKEQGEGFPVSSRLEELPPLHREKVLDLSERINVGQAEGVAKFGVSVQTQVSAFYDRVLTQVRAKDTKPVEAVLERLLGKLRSLDVGAARESTLWSRVPFFRRWAPTLERFTANYDKANAEVTGLAERLNDACSRLLQDIEVFDKLYAQNLDHLLELDVYVLAAQIKVAELREGRLQELSERAEATSDPMDAHKLQDFDRQVQRLERKLRELETARTISIQTAGQIRLIQNDIQTLVERIQATVLTSVPLWRNQIAIAIGRSRQKKTLRLERDLTRATVGMLEANSEMLKKGSLASSQVVRDEAELKALRKVTDDLLASVGDGKAAGRKGSAAKVRSEPPAAKADAAGAARS